jgi:hypothetical protein
MGNPVWDITQDTNSYLATNRHASGEIAESEGIYMNKTSLSDEVEGGLAHQYRLFLCVGPFVWPDREKQHNEDGSENHWLELCQISTHHASLSPQQLRRRTQRPGKLCLKHL